MGKNSTYEIIGTSAQQIALDNSNIMCINYARKTKCQVTEKPLGPGYYVSAPSSAYAGNINYKAIHNEVVALLLYKVAPEMLKPSIRKLISKRQQAEKI